MLLGALALAASTGISPVSAATLSARAFGKTASGQPVMLYTMKNANGVSVSFMTYGGVVTSIMAPDRNGHQADIVNGFSTLGEYEAKSRAKGVFFGALIGRFANRIANGRFTLDGHQYTLPINNGPNSLHGGIDGFDRRLWKATEIPFHDGTVGVRLTLVSPDGDQGYPGALTVAVTYTLSNRNEFGIDYTATATRPTVLNLTNHSYFNLAGIGTPIGVLGQMLQINASRYTPTNNLQIPTGELAPVAETPFDFLTAKPIGRDIHTVDPQLLAAQGYDHNWVLDGKKDANGLTRAATLWDPVSGRSMTCSTSEPGVQVYTSNFLDGTLAGKGAIYRQSDGITFETQHFPDSPNQRSFPTTRLEPGQTFHSRTVFAFGLHNPDAANGVTQTRGTN